MMSCRKHADPNLSNSYCDKPKMMAWIRDRTVYKQINHRPSQLPALMIFTITLPKFHCAFIPDPVDNGLAPRTKSNYPVIHLMRGNTSAMPKNGDIHLHLDHFLGWGILERSLVHTNIWLALLILGSTAFLVDS
jgi:hypothetical protein